MKEVITAYVGLDIHKDTVAVAVADEGRATPWRILVESAWTYRFNPRVSRPLEVRQCGQPKVIRDIAWKAQLRLTYRFKKLNAGRKMTQNKCCVAVARELAGFIWDIARHVKITTA